MAELRLVAVAVAVAAAIAIAVAVAVAEAAVAEPALAFHMKHWSSGWVAEPLADSEIVHTFQDCMEHG